MQAGGMQDDPGSKGPGPDTATIPLAATSPPSLRLEHPRTSTLPLREPEVMLVGQLQLQRFPLFSSPTGAGAHPNPMPHFGRLFQASEHQRGGKTWSTSEAPPGCVAWTSLGLQTASAEKVISSKKVL